MEEVTAVLGPIDTEYQSLKIMYKLTPLSTIDYLDSKLGLDSAKHDKAWKTRGMHCQNAELFHSVVSYLSVTP